MKKRRVEHWKYTDSIRWQCVCVGVKILFSNFIIIIIIIIAACDGKERKSVRERETLLSGKVPQGLLLHYQICNVAKFKSFSRDDVINEDDEKVHLIDSDGFKLSPSENDTKITVWLEHAWLSHIISKSSNFSSDDDAKENFVSKTQKILLQLQSQHDDRQCRCRGKFMRLNLQQKEMT